VPLAAVIAAGAAWWARNWLRTPIHGLGQDTTFEVPRGASLSSIAAALRERGLLDQPQVWIAWARLSGRAGDLKAGEYGLHPGLTPRGLLDLLTSGDVLLHNITFVEGSTFADLRRALAANDAVRAEYAGSS